jgi:hypothetical protein
VEPLVAPVEALVDGLPPWVALSLHATAAMAKSPNRPVIEASR